MREEAVKLVARWTTSQHPWRGSTEVCQIIAQYARELEEQLEAAERECGEAWTQYNDSERHADEMRQLAHRQGETIYDLTVQVASLRHALKTVRAECDLPDHIAEFIGEALAASNGLDRESEKVTVTKSAHLPITEERPRDAGTSGATT